MNVSDIFNRNCDKCSLHNGATRICVPGSGRIDNLKLVVIGEAPGREEDLYGEPFIGKAGKLLKDYMIRCGIDLNTVRFENVTRCFPNDNGVTKQPEPEHVEACLPYLYRILRLIKENHQDLPKIVALGNVALKALTGESKITVNHGTFFPLKIQNPEFKDLDDKFQVMGVIHPSAVLRGNSGHEKTILSDLTHVWSVCMNKVRDYGAEYVWLNSPDAVDSYIDTQIERFNDKEIECVSYDIETTGLETYDTKSGLMKTVSYQLCTDIGKGVLVPLYHKDSDWKDDLFVQERLWSSLGRMLDVIPITGWNLPFDIKWSKIHMGVSVKRVFFDALFASRFISAGQKNKNWELNSVAAEELGFYGHGDEIWKEMAALPKGQNNFSNANKSTLLKYGVGDVDAALQLTFRRIQLLKETGLYDSFQHMLMRAELPICQLELNGVAINVAMNQHMMEKYPALMEPHFKAIIESPYGIETSKVLASRNKPLKFNLKSDVTIQTLVYDKMGLMGDPEKQKAVGFSLDKEALEDLIEYCNSRGWHDRKELLEHLQEWKANAHTYTNFVKNLPKYYQYDGLFHTQYNLTGTDTGRASSSKPSIHGQQKGESGVRQQFASRWARQGGLILSGDFSQMEMRVLAALSGDPNLIEAISSGLDIHTANASKMFNVPVEHVDPKMRDKAKRSGFGVIYGIGPQTLAVRIGSTVREAEEIIQSWYDVFPLTLEFQKMEYKKAKKYGFVATNFGRIRWVENIEKSRWGDRAWRQVVNSNIQSTASDITLMALLEVFFEVEKRGLKSKMFGFVHDSIITDIYPGELWEILDIKKDKMVRWVNSEWDWMTAPVTADYEICPGWGFPCTLTAHDGDQLSVTGSKMSTTLLINEVKRIGKIIDISSKIDDKGKEKVTVTFTK